MLHNVSIYHLEQLVTTFQKHSMNPYLASAFVQLLEARRSTSDFITLREYHIHAFSMSELCPDLGLHFGRRMALRTPDLLRQHTLSTHTLLNMIQFVIMYSNLICSHSHWERVCIYHGEGIIQDDMLQTGDLLPFYCDAFLAYWHTIFTMCNIREPEQVRYGLKCSPPDHHQGHPLLTHLNHIEYDQPCTFVRLPAESLMQQFNLRTFERQCVDALMEAPRSIAEDRTLQQTQSQLYQTVIDLIIQLIRNKKLSSPPIDQIAAQLNISVSTLQRRLKKLGLNYQKILDLARTNMASLLLAQKTMSVKEVADMMGYEHTSNFSRDFKKWTGTSVSEFRKHVSPARSYR